MRTIWGSIRPCVVLKDQPQTICYLNDILITGKTEAEHLQNLEEVLRRLQEQGFKVKVAKYKFIQPSVNTWAIKLTLVVYI